MKKSVLENNETIIWKGQNEYHEFVELVKALKYKFLIKCFDKEKVLDVKLGAACSTKDELDETLQIFFEMGYTCKYADLMKMSLI